MCALLHSAGMLPTGRPGRRLPPAAAEPRRGLGSPLRDDVDGLADRLTVLVLQREPVYAELDMIDELRVFRRTGKATFKQTPHMFRDDGTWWAHSLPVLPNDYLEVRLTFGKGDDELTMCFDFIGMQNMYLSLVRGDGVVVLVEFGARVRRRQRLVHRARLVAQSLEHAARGRGQLGAHQRDAVGEAHHLGIGRGAEGHHLRPHELRAAQGGAGGAAGRGRVQPRRRLRRRR